MRKLVVLAFLDVLGVLAKAAASGDRKARRAL